MSEPARAARDAVDRVLAGADPLLREELHLRLERWWDDLHDALRQAYPATAGDLAVQLVEHAAAAYRDRDPELRRLDRARVLRPGWFQDPSMLGYAAYTERFAGDLVGVSDRIGYLRELGVTYLHLMPLLLPREGDNDGGYAVADYRTVRPDLGTMDDLGSLTRDLRAHGISLVLDLVLNHVAREHAWAQAARAGDPGYRAYFHVFADRTEPDAYERTLPEVFPDFAPGSFTFDDDLDAWVWTTFNAWQWDLNWANPQVLVEFADLVLHLANQGVEVFRLDAVAFLWKRLGTTCQNQPEVHAITQALRAVARIACPAVVFKAEAIVGPTDLLAYLGEGSHHGKVSDLAYHNSLMVQVWSMLAAQEARLAVAALRSLPPPPPSTAWITYVRCHDDIGWAIDDRDDQAGGVTGDGHRAFLSDFYAGDFPGSTARGLVFQANPATGDRRISGTTASLAGLAAAREAAGDAPGAVDDPAVRTAVRRVLLAHALVMGWGGIPVIWSGDELAQPNDAGWAQEPGHASDNRWAHRPRLDWRAAERRDDVATVEGQVFQGLRHLARVRAALPHLDASIGAEVLDLDDQAVLAVLRRHPVGPMVGLYNVSGRPARFGAWRLAELGLAAAHDVIGGVVVRPDEHDDLWLEPYQARWLVESPAAQPG